MKAIARQTVYWKNIDKDIESLVKNYKECALNLKNPEPAPLHPWDMPKEPWTRIHIDFAEAFGKRFLIVVSRYKMPEPAHCRFFDITLTEYQLIFG